MNPLQQLHTGYVHGRRVRVLSDILADLMPQDAQVLDVGCGDGLLAHLIMQKRPDIKLSGTDVLVRPHTYISIERFDGQVIPSIDHGFDVVMFVDVLHHVQDPMILLREAMRVARRAIIIKDHTCEGLLARPTLRFMDWVGNAHHGVSLPYNYWPQKKWLDAFDWLDLTIRVWKKDLQLYPPSADWLFGRSLHFLSRLDLSKPNNELAIC
jgi:SAM-dependent methyltransferase